MKLTTTDFRNTARRHVQKWVEETKIFLNPLDETALVTEFIQYASEILGKASEKVKEDE